MLRKTENRFRRLPKVCGREKIPYLFSSLSDNDAGQIKIMSKMDIPLEMYHSVEKIIRHYIGIGIPQECVQKIPQTIKLGNIPNGMSNCRSSASEVRTVRCK
jgi:hypothetical protein